MSVTLPDSELLTHLPLLADDQVQLRFGNICARYQVAQVSLFGSALRTDFSAESDLDLLVEFLPGNTIGLIQLANLELELTDLLQRKVDVRTAGDLSRYFRNEVRESAHAFYSA